MKLVNKEGQFNTFLPYIFIGLIIVFIFAIVVIPVALVGDTIFDELKDEGNLGRFDTAKNVINKVQNLTTPIFDQIVFVLLIATILGTLVVALFTDYHPVILGVMILAIVLLVIVSGLFANMYDDFTSNEMLQDKSDEFTFTNIIMGKQLPIIILFVGVVSVIILLSKRGRLTAPI